MSIISGLLEKRLDPNHELLILGRTLDWDSIEDQLAHFYKPGGRPGKPIRLLVGLQLLKHRFDLSDEEVVAGVQENLYWMALCGLEGKLGTADWPTPLHSTTLTKFRQRIGPEGTALIEDILRQQLLAARQIRPKSQVVDTTVQPKHIAYPRDTHLLDRGRRWVAAVIEKLGALGAARPIYHFGQQAKRIVIDICKLGKDKADRLQAGTQQLIHFAQQVLDQVPTALAVGAQALSEQVQRQAVRLRQQLQQHMDLLRRVIAQAEARMVGRHLPHKVLSLHEPHVAAIAKGKPRIPYEYGVKVALSMDSSGYVVCHQEYADARADLQTLDPALTAWEQVCGRPARELAGDRGFYTGKPSAIVLQVEKVAIPTTGNQPHPDRKVAYFRRLQRRRAAIEAVISHLKRDHGLGRCRYQGFDGDQMNAAWAVMAWNAKKWARNIRQQAIQAT
jgi:IS5 family transposase